MALLDNNTKFVITIVDKFIKTLKTHIEKNNTVKKGIVIDEYAIGQGKGIEKFKSEMLKIYIDNFPVPQDDDIFTVDDVLRFYETINLDIEGRKENLETFDRLDRDFKVPSPSPEAIAAATAITEGVSKAIFFDWDDTLAFKLVTDNEINAATQIFGDSLVLIEDGSDENYTTTDIINLLVDITKSNHKWFIVSCGSNFNQLKKLREQALKIGKNINATEEVWLQLGAGCGGKNKLEATRELIRNHFDDNLPDYSLFVDDSKDNLETIKTSLPQIITIRPGQGEKEEETLDENNLMVKIEATFFVDAGDVRFFKKILIKDKIDKIRRILNLPEKGEELVTSQAQAQGGPRPQPKPEIQGDILIYRINDTEYNKYSNVELGVAKEELDKLNKELENESPIRSGESRLFITPEIYDKAKQDYIDALERAKTLFNLNEQIEIGRKTIAERRKGETSPQDIINEIHAVETVKRAKDNVDRLYNIEELKVLDNAKKYIEANIAYLKEINKVLQDILTPVVNVNPDSQNGGGKKKRTHNKKKRRSKKKSTPPR